jgi:hypothetical protein
MKTDDIRWESFERSALPQALFGNATAGVRGWRMENALEAGQGIALGYSAEEERRAYKPPALIVLEDRAAAETMSWLKAYAPETSPLSQFARVVSRSDWERLGGESSGRTTDAVREDGWACVVLGELLAQGESDVDVNTIPFSWSASCFSTAVARTSIIHVSEDARQTCVERLRSIEKDQRFWRRPISIAALEPVWTVAASSQREPLSVQEVVDLVFSAIKRVSDGPPAPKLRTTAAFGPQSEFFSDSVESRVIAFQRLVAEMSEEIGDAGPTALPNAMLAAGAFLVGRGTSHGFLLARLAKRWSHALPWFGLMAGLAGSQSWDGGWSRAVKGVERLLRGRFEWCGVSVADLSWIEYSWLTTTFVGKQVFAEMPKMVPKVVSVEIVPGAACQLRLAVDAGGPREATRSDRAETERRDRELRATLQELASLALRARHLIGSEPSQRAEDQASLGFDDAGGKSSTASRSRRGKRDQS